MHFRVSGLLDDHRPAIDDGGDVVREQLVMIQWAQATSPIDEATVHALEGEALKDGHDSGAEAGVGDDTGDLGVHDSRKLEFGGLEMDVDVSEIQIHLRPLLVAMSVRQAVLVLVPDQRQDLFLEAGVAEGASFTADERPGNGRGHLPLVFVGGALWRVGRAANEVAVAML